MLTRVRMLFKFRLSNLTLIFPGTAPCRFSNFIRVVFATRFRSWTIPRLSLKRFWLLLSVMTPSAGLRMRPMSRTILYLESAHGRPWQSKSNSVVTEKFP